jgi:hypothetical protein
VGGIDAMLLRKLPRTHRSSPLVEYLLHRLEHVLRVRCRRAIRFLLTLNDNIHNLAEFDRRQILGPLNLVDLRLSFGCDCVKARIQVARTVVGRRA